MKTLFKLIIGLVVLCLLVVVGALAYLAFIDLNDYKDAIVARVQEATGRDFEIAGDIQHTFYPWLGIELDGVKLGNAPGFDDVPFMKADQVALRVKLMPLLREQFELDTIRVHGGEINLAKNADGITNWDDLGGDEEHKGEPLDLAALALGGVDIQRTRFTWSDAGTGTIYRVSELTISTGPLTYGEPIALTLTASIESNQPELRSDISVDGTVAYDLDDQRYLLKPLDATATLQSKNIPAGQEQLRFTAAVDLNLKEETAAVSDLDLSALGTVVRGTLHASEIASGEPTVNGQLQIDGADIALLFKVLEVEPLASELAKLADKSFRLTAKMTAAQGNVSLSDLAANLLGAAISGQLDARNVASETPALDGRLKAVGPDLPMLLKVAGQFQASGERTLAELGSSLSNSAHKSFDVTAAFQADMANGDVAVPELAANIFGASISGALEAHNVTSDAPAVKGRLKAVGPDLSMLLKVAGHFQAPGERTLAEFGANLSKSSNKSFDIAAVFDADVANGDVDVSELAAKAAGLNVNGKLKGTAMNTERGTIDGNLTIRGQRLAGLMTALGQQELGEVLNTFSADAVISGSGGNYTLSPLKAKVSLAGKKIPKGLVDVTLSAAVRTNLDKQTATLNDLRLTGLGLNVKGNVNATGIQDEPAFNGNLDVAQFDLRRLLQQLNQEVPRTADPNVLKHVALKAQFDGTSNSLSLKGLSMNLDQTRLNGDFSVVNFDDPDITFGITIDQLNADRYMSPEQAKNARPPTPEMAAAGAAGLPLETLRALKLKGNLSIGQLTFAKARMTGVRLSINARDGKIDLNPSQARLYQGMYKGNVVLDASRLQPQLNINSTLTGVQAEPLLIDLTGSSKVAGTANFTATLKAFGSDADTIKRTLNGNSRFVVHNGVFRGIDVGSVLRQTEIMIENKRPGNVNRGEQTRFDSVAGTIQVNNGVITNNDLLLRAPGFQVTGAGTLGNLTTERIKYGLLASATASRETINQNTYNLGGYDLPIRCNGTFADPGCVPDVNQIIKAAIGNVVQDALRDAIQGGDPGESLKKLFKF